jgi:hypothetical protein
MRGRLALAAVLAVMPALAPARSDVCVSTNAGPVCAGPAGPRTTVTVNGECCIFLESTGPVPIGRTGVQGSSVLGQSATVTIWANWARPVVVTVTPGKQTARAEVGSQVFYVTNHIGCCIEIDATGPVSLERTGAFGGENVTLWWNGRRVLRCRPAVSVGPRPARMCQVARPI